MNLDLIKELREETKASIKDIRKAISECDGDRAKVVEYLRKISKNSDAETPEGFVFSYTHAGGQVGVLLHLACQTDFVARNDEFQKLGKDLCLQVASMAPDDIDVLLDQGFIRDSSLTISERINQTQVALGEKLVVKRFQRFTVKT